MSIDIYSIHTRSMETRYHHHHGHNIPHCGGEGVLNTANSKANDRTLMQFMPLSPSILGVCRRSKYARWRDTIDEDDPRIWGLDSMIKSSTAPDYVYPCRHGSKITVGGRRLCFFISAQLPFSFSQKGYFLASFGFLPLRIGMSLLLRKLCSYCPFAMKSQNKIGQSSSSGWTQYFSFVVFA